MNSIAKKMYTHNQKYRALRKYFLFPVYNKLLNDCIWPFICHSFEFNKEFIITLCRKIEMYFMVVAINIIFRTSLQIETKYLKWRPISASKQQLTTNINWPSDFLEYYTKSVKNLQCLSHVQIHVNILKFELLICVICLEVMYKMSRWI